MMSTTFDLLALRFAKACTPDKGWSVCVLSMIAIALLTWQFGALALAALVGSLIGLAIQAMAYRGSRWVKNAIHEISFHWVLNRAESRALVIALTTVAACSLRRVIRQAFGAITSILDGLGIVHVALSPRLYPTPLLSRA